MKRIRSTVSVSTFCLFFLLSLSSLVATLRGLPHSFAIANRDTFARPQRTCQLSSFPFYPPSSWLLPSLSAHPVFLSLNPPLSYARLAIVKLPPSPYPVPPPDVNWTLGRRITIWFPIQIPPPPPIRLVVVMSSLLLPALHVPPSPPPPEDDVSSSESSSIGSASSEAEDDSEIKDDVTSSLGSLSSLEDSLPIKKGLSNNFVGKSRSFSNLSECENGNAVDLAKGEKPFNKRRRIQIASRISYQRRASCSSLPLPPLLSPEHALQEAEEENDDDDNSDDNDNDGGRRTGKNFPSLAPTLHGGNLFNGKIIIVNKGKAKIKSPRSFPLFDL